MKNFKLKNRILGFTIVELLVVIAIISILTSVSVLGYGYSLKRSAISNDKALVNQLNRILDSHAVYNHNETKIANALIEELGTDILSEALPYGYDIYYNTDIEEFELLSKSVYDGKYHNLKYYLQQNNAPITAFAFNEQYSSDGASQGTNYSKITKINNNLIAEYELEVGINPIFDENKIQFKDGSHTVNIDELLIINGDVELTYQLSIHSEVIYDLASFSEPEISNGKITFSYPGTYYLHVSDNETTKSIRISVINTNYQSGHISINKLNTPEFDPNNDNSYNLNFRFYLNLVVEDYHYDENAMIYSYVALKTTEYTIEQQKHLVDTQRISIQVNGENKSIEKIGSYYCFSINNLTEDENDFSITFNYLGFNGIWDNLTLNIKVIKDANDNITIEYQ